MDRLARADYLKGLITEYEAFNMDDLGNRQSTTLRDGSSDTYAVDALTNRYNSIDSAIWKMRFDHRNGKATKTVTWQRNIDLSTWQPF